MRSRPSEKIVVERGDQELTKDLNACVQKKGLSMLLSSRCGLLLSVMGCAVAS